MEVLILQVPGGGLGSHHLWLLSWSDGGDTYAW